MSVEAMDKFLDENAIPVTKDKYVRAWLSPAARDSHARTAESVRLLASLFSVMTDSFRRSGMELNKSSVLQRIENTELPDLGFWVCRPTANGPTYMLIVQRIDDPVEWQPRLEQALLAD